MAKLDIDQVLHALAHPIRRDIVDFVAETPGSNNGEICERFSISRIAIAKHIKILAEADLLVIEPDGRFRLHYFNVMPIQMLYERWTNEYSRFFATKMHHFQLELEEQDNPGDSNEKTA